MKLRVSVSVKYARFDPSESSSETLKTSLNGRMLEGVGMNHSFGVKLVLLFESCISHYDDGFVGSVEGEVSFD
jgi:hypothetical protein